MGDDVYAFALELEIQGEQNLSFLIYHLTSGDLVVGDISHQGFHPNRLDLLILAGHVDAGHANQVKLA